MWATTGWWARSSAWTRQLTTIQVYEETTGLRPASRCTPPAAPCAPPWVPASCDNIFDGIERPLKAIEKETGAFIARGCSIPSLDPDAKWEVTVTVKAGDKIVPGQVYATCPETPVIPHKCMVPPAWSGTVTWVAPRTAATP